MPLSAEQEDFIQRWTTALRSGEYKKGIGKLKHKPFNTDYWTYCCLGVALVIDNVPHTEINRWDGLTATFRTPDENKSASLPTFFVEKYGFDSIFATFRITDEMREEHTDLPNDTNCTSLANTNDSLEWDFPKIADFIEKHKENILKPL